MEMDHRLIRLVEELAEEFADLPLAFVARAVGDSARRFAAHDQPTFAGLRRDLEALRFLWPSESGKS